MKGWRDHLRNPTVWLQIISIIITLLILWRVTMPFQEKMLRKVPDVVLDIIPSVGQIDKDIYYTKTRPVNADLTIDLYVIVWNKGNGTAENVSITLRSEPQVASWYDYHWSIVSISGFMYRPSHSNASIRALLPNQQAQIQYHVSFMPSGYDQLIKEGKEPKIIIELEYASTSQRYEYLVEMP